jgi:hypothetical protein
MSGAFGIATLDFELSCNIEVFLSSSILEQSCVDRVPFLMQYSLSSWTI